MISDLDCWIMHCSREEFLIEKFMLLGTKQLYMQKGLKYRLEIEDLTRVVISYAYEIYETSLWRVS